MGRKKSETNLFPSALHLYPPEMPPCPKHRNNSAWSFRNYSNIIAMGKTSEVSVGLTGDLGVLLCSDRQSLLPEPFWISSQQIIFLSLAMDSQFVQIKVTEGLVQAEQVLKLVHRACHVIMKYNPWVLKKIMNLVPMDVTWEINQCELTASFGGITHSRERYWP